MTRATPPFAWGHINVNVTDLEASIAFYARLGFGVFVSGIPYLGLEREGPPKTLPDEMARACGLPLGTKGRACILELGGGMPKLDLIETDATEAGATATANADVGLVRICLATANLANDYAELAARGVEFVSPPAAGHGGLADIAICRDPDGTLIELIEIHLDRWAEAGLLG